MLASVASMIEQFNMSNIELLQSMGYQVDVACNFKKGNTFSADVSNIFWNKLITLNVRPFQIDFDRDVFNISADFKALREVNRLMKENQYDFVHCHSPIGGVVARIIAHRYNVKVIYTAHGFHFFAGAPLKNWLIYYPIEKHYSKFTDILITINHEDYNRANKKFYAKKVDYVPGVGIDTVKFSANIFTDVQRGSFRKSLGVPEDSVLLLSVGELNENKNHEIVLKALGKIKQINPVLSSKVYYTVAGVGIRKDFLQNLCTKFGIESNVKLLGFRSDVLKLYKSADIFVMPSHREGLSVALMEAMASGLPCVVSRIRGNTDLIDENGGRFFDSNNVDECMEAIQCFSSITSEQRESLGFYNQSKIKLYDKGIIVALMKKIYAEVDNPIPIDL